MDSHHGGREKKYAIQLSILNRGHGVDLTAATVPCMEPIQATFQTTTGADRCTDFNDFPDCLDKHMNQDVAGTKFCNSHFRPCLPVEGPLPSGCAPRESWRPSLPPAAPPSGKHTRTVDKFGSSWQNEVLSRHNKPCRLDSNWLLHTHGRSPNNKHRRAGKPSDYGGTLLFPGAHVSEHQPRVRPYGKNIGDILARLRPRSGDVFILPCISALSKLDPRGYVGFVHNANSNDGSLLRWDGGTMLLRIAKFRDSTLRTRKQIKLFLLTVDQQWRLKGVLDSSGYLEDICMPSNYRNVPVRYRRCITPNTSDRQCIPQRGDILIREPWKDLFSDRTDKNSAVMWWQPGLELDINDVLVRTCVWRCCDECEAFVDLYCYNGKGLRWVFLGRDETVFQLASSGGHDSDTSDDEKLGPDPGTVISSPNANPIDGNLPHYDDNPRAIARSDTGDY